MTPDTAVKEVTDSAVSADVLRNEPAKDQYTAQAKLCQRSLETLLASLPFHLPSTYDYVLALALAVRGPV
jgi:hypothetical protein